MSSNAWFPKAEGILYAWFHRQAKITRLRFDLGLVQSRLDKAMADVHKARTEFRFAVPSGIANYHGTSVQSFIGEPYLEHQVEKVGEAIEHLERRMLKLAGHSLRLKAKIYGLEEQQAALAYAMSRLTEEERNIAELKYGCRMSCLMIGAKFHLAEASVRRTRARIVRKIATELHLI